MEMKFESNGFEKRLKSMLKVDFLRMFKSRLIYIMLGIALVCPILILVMTTMMGDATVTNPTTGEVTPMETFTNTWQAISSPSGAGMSMDLTGMCNMNMMYFAAAVLVCLFVSDDFRSGYSKNLFTVRSGKVDYVISKTLVCFIGGALMIVAWFMGSMLGGAVAGLSFDTMGAGTFGVLMCIISKIAVMAVFVPIFLTMAVVAKQRAWLSICLSLAVGMLLFMMIPMMTPLDAGMMNVVLCVVGGALFSIGLGAVSNIILNKTSLV